MKIKILDYKDRVKEVEIPELKDIDRIGISVVTGDEILTVVCKEQIVEYDSSNDRTRNFYDGCYEVYNKEKGINILENEEWLNRTNYSYLRKYGDTSEADMSDWW